MDQKYQKLSPEMKAKVAIEALRGDQRIRKLPLNTKSTQNKL